MLLKRQIEDLEKGLKISMLSRVFTALSLISVILVVLYLQNIWLFTSLIFLVCIIAFYEWIKNKFNKIVFGFILIFYKNYKSLPFQEKFLRSFCFFFYHIRLCKTQNLFLLVVYLTVRLDSVRRLHILENALI